MPGNPTAQSRFGLEGTKPLIETLVNIGQIKKFNLRRWECID